MLKKLSTAIALGLVVGVLSIPATSFAGKGAGPGDGTGDNIKCLDGVVDEYGVCICNDLLGSITPKGNFDVAAGQNGPKGDGIPDLECVEGVDSLNPACWGAISTEGNFDVAEAAQNGNQTGDRVGDGDPDQIKLQDGSCLLDA